MRPSDHSLSARIRAIFVQRWVDLSCLDYGVTNGVVYLKGTLRHYLGRTGDADQPGNRVDEADRAREEEVELARSLEWEIWQVKGVRDIAFRLNNLTKRGPTWVHR